MEQVKLNMGIPIVLSARKWAYGIMIKDVINRKCIALSEVMFCIYNNLETNRRSMGKTKAKNLSLKIIYLKLENKCDFFFGLFFFCPKTIFICCFNIFFVRSKAGFKEKRPFLLRR